MIFRQQTWVVKVVREVSICVCSLDGRAPKGVSTWVFPNLRKMHEYWNLS
jgi:hypothetical protein